MTENQNQPEESAAKKMKLDAKNAMAGWLAGAAATARSVGHFDRCLIEAVRDPMAITAFDGKIIYVNSAMEMATGFDRATMIGAELAGYFTDPEAARAAHKGVLDGGFLPECALELRHRDGRVTPVIYNPALQRDDQGAPIGLIAAARNVAALKRAEEQLARAGGEMERKVRERTARLEETNRELEAFAHSVSHDLRAPLRGIDAFSHRLLEHHAHQLDAAGRADLDRIVGAAHRMGELIDDLLKLSSVNRHELSRAPVNLSLLAESVLDGLRKAEPERRVQFIVAPHLVAPADERMVRIVFENLLANAWKFVGKQSAAQIEFGVVEGKGVRAFFVRDNGVGFNAEYARRLFGPFQRFHSRADFPGTGIGLATVQRVIHRHGGRVWAESRVGQGAAFYFTLPEPAR
jgi:PAS domain S-box-containing protein